MKERKEAAQTAETARFFTNDREALFMGRPNRFLITAKDGNEEIACHCPNPGRLIEFLFPGERLVLEKREPHKGRSQAKTCWTAAGIYCRDGVAPLFAARANRVAEGIILAAIIPGLREIRPEYRIGSSRFDFLGIDSRGKKHLIEVKACSLVEYGVAMFPDAPSARALKHLEELAELARTGWRCHVLFVIVRGKAASFVPNLHTDPQFAAGLHRYGIPANAPGAGMSGDKVLIHACLVRCDPDGNAALADPYVPVDLSHGVLASEDRGNYLILLEIPEERAIAIGALGTLTIHPGWYVYTGSAQKNLSRRISRHLRRIRKQRHWHIDYLTPYAETIAALPIMSYRNLECDLARSIRSLSGRAVPGFGCSDCRCGSHLFYFAKPPLENRAFVEMLLHYRHIEALRH
jgi:sugar fermentation stimulation protein A